MRPAAREHEVLLLIARGLSNAGLARVLVLEGSTVKKHVANVLSKLELTSAHRPSSLRTSMASPDQEPDARSFPRHGSIGGTEATSGPDGCPVIRQASSRDTEAASIASRPLATVSRWQAAR